MAPLDWTSVFTRAKRAQWRACVHELERCCGTRLSRFAGKRAEFRAYFYTVVRAVSAATLLQNATIFETCMRRVLSWEPKTLPIASNGVFTCAGSQLRPTVATWNCMVETSPRVYDAATGADDVTDSQLHIARGNKDYGYGVALRNDDNTHYCTFCLLFPDRCLSNDGVFYAIFDDGGTPSSLTVYHTLSHRIVLRCRDVQTPSFNALPRVFSSDSTRISLLCGDGSVRVYRLGKTEAQTRLVLEKEPALKGAAEAVAFSQCDQFLVMWQGTEILLADANDGRQISLTERRYFPLSNVFVYKSVILCESGRFVQLVKTNNATLRWGMRSPVLFERVMCQGAALVVVDFIGDVCCVNVADRYGNDVCSSEAGANIAHMEVTRDDDCLVYASKAEAQSEWMLDVCNVREHLVAAANEHST